MVYASWGGVIKAMTRVKALLLAAGFGSRLHPLTEIWPKCLMPIGGVPLLEYWLAELEKLNVQDVLVNTHFHSEKVQEFLEREIFKDRVNHKYEEQLLGTAGTLYENLEYFLGNTVLFIHGDNWSQCNFKEFLNYHFSNRPENTLMTMMTFRTSAPENCGIVELDDNGVVHGFHEKVPDPPGNLANASIYLLDPEILELMRDRPTATDFDIEIIPELLGKIATWENTGIHRDIGYQEALKLAQQDPLPQLGLHHWDSWLKEFASHPIHEYV